MTYDMGHDLTTAATATVNQFVAKWDYADDDRTNLAA